jgi:RimJ/RimL family protein N-acetyltransferase
MDNQLFTGKLLRLTDLDPLERATASAHWARNSEYMRLLDDGASPLWSVKKRQEWNEKDLDEEKSDGVLFNLVTLAEERLIGFFGLWLDDDCQNDYWLGIGIGEPEFWGRGYGSDALRLALRYAFQELNAHHVSLGVFEYNPRAQRAYEKAGFRHEGRIRQELLRGGKRWDVLLMGILRREWDADVIDTN